MLYETTGIGAWSDALQPKLLWAGLWPVLIGAVLALGLWRWGRHLPQAPEGDIVVAGERAVGVLFTWGDTLERMEGKLRRWPVAALMLLVITFLIGGALVGGQ